MTHRETGREGSPPAAKRSASSQAAAERKASSGDRRARDDEPVLPQVSRDETDVGWGDDRDERDADWYRRERPPHHE